MVPPESELDIDRLVDHLFRREAGRLIAILTRIFGPEHTVVAPHVLPLFGPFNPQVLAACGAM